MPELMNTKKLVGKVKSFFKRGVPEEEMFHKDLVKISTQMRLTQNLIQNNEGVLQELAKDDANVASLIETALGDSEREAIGEKILSREDISIREAKHLTDSLDKVTESMSNLGVNLEVNVGDLVGDFQGLLNDNRVDITQRRKILTETKDFLEEKGIESSALEDLVALSKQNLNFTEKERDSVNKVLSQIVQDTTNVKIHSTLNDLNRSMDSAVLTQDELKEVMEKQTSEGKAFREVFEDLPSMFSKGAVGGVVSSALDLAVPGLGSLLDGFGGLEAIAGIAVFKKFGKFFGKGGKALKTMSGVAKSVPGAITGISKLGKLTGVLKGLTKFKGLKTLALAPAAIGALKVVPNLFKSFFKRVPDIVQGALKIPGIKKAGVKVVEEVGAKAIPKAVAKVATKVGVKMLGKGAIKSIAKKLPILGALAGVYFALEKFKKGDIVGAGLEIVSGGLGAVGLGAVGLGVDAVIVARDLSKGKEKVTAIPQTVTTTAEKTEIKRELKITRDTATARAAIPTAVATAIAAGTRTRASVSKKTTDRRLIVDDFGIAYVNSVIFG